MKTLNRRFCVAPMMERTDRHCRYFFRLLSRHAVLYTEMITTAALIHGDRQRFLAFNEAEHPVAVQLGGSDPAELATCAAMAEAFGYDEVNLNVGCPSDRVQQHRIGACLMAEPELVARCVAATKGATGLPVTVKHRIGIDDLDSEALLHRFVETVARAGCETFIVHARKAWLSGLSPKQNREIPPLDYPRVYRLKQAFPELEIIINGGITTLAECEQHLQQVDGVMVGRAACHNPFVLSGVDQAIFASESAPPSRHEVARLFLPYIEQQMARGVRLNHLSRHLLGLFHGKPGGKQFRRHLSEQAWRPGAGIQVIEEALDRTGSEQVLSQ